MKKSGMTTRDENVEGWRTINFRDGRALATMARFR